MGLQITVRHGRVLMLIVSVLLLAGGVSGAVAGADSAPPDDLTAGPTSSDVSTGNGTQDVLVYFEPATSGDDFNAMGDHAASDITVDRLTEHARTTQEPLEQYAAETAGVSVKRSFWLGNAALITVDEDRLSTADLSEIDGVERVGPNAEVRINTTARDGGAAASPVPARPPNAGMAPPPFSPPESQLTTRASVSVSANDVTYGLDQINVPAVWNEYRTRGERTTIAVLDTGVDPDHPDIELSAWGDWDPLGNERTTEPKDYGAHGTHVSATVSGGNASGTHIGVAPETKLHHGAVLTDCGRSSCTGTGAQILAGMQWAVERDADVISMSFGAEGYEDGFIRPVRDAQNAGTMVVSAAGNAGDNTSNSPGNIYNVTSVGASDQNREIADFSSGELVDWPDPPADWPDEYIVPTVAAPGVSVYSAVPDDSYSLMSGTSMAVPHVSGAAALIQSGTETELSPPEIKQALMETATKPESESPDQDTRYGHGIIDTKAAIDSVMPQFELAITSTNLPVVEGEPLELDVTVTNTGAVNGTQWITLDLDGEQADATELALDGGDSQTVTLKRETDIGDAGEYTATIASENTSVSTTVAVRERGTFLSITETNSPVFVNDTLLVNVTTESTIPGTESHLLQLRTNDTVRGEKTITLEQWENTSTQLAWQTTPTDRGEHTLTVSSASDSDSVPVSVEKPGNFSVDLERTNGPVAEGETLTVNATVQNLGNGTATQSITLLANDTERSTKLITLAPGASTTASLSWLTTGGDAGDHAITVASEDDTDTGIVSVSETEPITVDITGTNAPITENETLSVNATLTNNGTENTTQLIRLLADGVEYNSTTVSLDPGNTTTVKLEWETKQGDTGERLLTVASVHHASMTNITIKSAEPTVGDYANSKKIIDTSGLRTAIRDWRADKITTSLLRDVIVAWRGGELIG